MLLTVVLLTFFNIPNRPNGNYSSVCVCIRCCKKYYLHSFLAAAGHNLCFACSFVMVEQIEEVPRFVVTLTLSLFPQAHFYIFRGRFNKYIIHSHTQESIQFFFKFVALRLHYYSIAVSYFRR